MSKEETCEWCGAKEYHVYQECQAVSLAKIAKALEKIAKGQK